MLAQLATIKTRLDLLDATHDALLTSAITAVTRPSLARITYTAGYVLPGTAPGPGQAALPADIEQAATEQVAYWFQKRAKLGLRTLWPPSGTYEQFLSLDLLPEVRTILSRHQRFSL